MAASYTPGISIPPPKKSLMLNCCFCVGINWQSLTVDKRVFQSIFAYIKVGVVTFGVGGRYLADSEN